MVVMTRNILLATHGGRHEAARGPGAARVLDGQTMTPYRLATEPHDNPDRRRSTRTMRRIRRDEPLPVTLTVSDRQLLLEHAFLSEPLDSRVRDAQPSSPKTVTVVLTPDELEELLEFVASAANHPETRALQRRFEDLYDRLTDIERGLDVQDE